MRRQEGHTGLDVSMRIRSYCALVFAVLCRRHLVLHQRLGFSLSRSTSVPFPFLPPLGRVGRHFCFVIIVEILTLGRGSHLLIRAFSLRPNLLRILNPVLTPSRDASLILVHRLQCLANSQQQHHQPFLTQPRMVHQIRVDHILQIASRKVGKQDVYGLLGGVLAIGDDGVINGVDDIGVRREEGVGLDFAESEGDGFLTKGAANLFEGVEVGGLGGVGDEVDVGEAALYGEVLLVVII